MGDYIWQTIKCPKCGRVIEMCDQTSSLLHSCHCDKCGYDDGLDWYDNGYNEIYLLTKKQAIAKKLLIKCPKCKRYCACYEVKEYGMCMMCRQKLDDKLNKLTKDYD